MTDQLPQVFIGSSAEGLDVAREVELHLEHEALTTIWKDGVFGLGSGTLESLMVALDGFDFAVMVLSPDDLLETRKTRYASPRDNVIFELGLFMGRLGRKRTFIVHEKDAGIKLPSDLDGITASSYRKHENLSAALSPTCTPIIKAIKILGLFEGRAGTQVDRINAESDAFSTETKDLSADHNSVDHIPSGGDTYNPLSEESAYPAVRLPPAAEGDSVEYDYELDLEAALYGKAEDTEKKFTLDLNVEPLDLNVEPLPGLLPEPEAGENE